MPTLNLIDYAEPAIEQEFATFPKLAWSPGAMWFMDDGVLQEAFHVVVDWMFKPRHAYHDRIIIAFRGDFVY